MVALAVVLSYRVPSPGARPSETNRYAPAIKGAPACCAEVRPGAIDEGIEADVGFV
jgi:hypothetical protein